MAGALALFLLLAASLTVVRAAGVALRLTGIPQHVARFQAISALTGAGYTTSESESTMRHPTRRRILMILMLTGHLGVVSLASTVIIAVTATEGFGGILVQVVALMAAVAFVYALAASERLDELMCKVVGRIMVHWNWISPTDQHVLYTHVSGQILAEHTVGEAQSLAMSDAGIRVLAVDGNDLSSESDALELVPGSTVLCIGSQADHDAFSARLQPGS